MVGMTLYQLICEQFPDLLKTYQINLFTYKNCSSGGDLVDWVVENSAAPRTRTEVVRMWQALLEERVIHHGIRVYVLNILVLCCNKYVSQIYNIKYY